MTNAPDVKETFLYKLSQTPGFEFFQHVVLISSPSDQYSPFDSSRIEAGSMLHKHQHRDAYVSMVRNIWAPVQPERVLRLDISFEITETNLDSFIGRTAHILFLENQPVMR